MDMDITSTIFIVLITITTEQLMTTFFKEFEKADSKERVRIILIIMVISLSVATLLVISPKNEAWKFLIRGTNLPSPIANWYTLSFGVILSLSLVISIFVCYKSPNTKGFQVWIRVILGLFEVVYLLFYRLFILDPNKIVANGTLQQLSIRALEQAIAFFYHFAFLGIFFLIANVSLAIDCYLDPTSPRSSGTSSP